MEATLRGAGTKLSCRKASDECCAVKVSMALLNHHFQAPKKMKVFLSESVVLLVTFCDTCTATTVDPQNPWILDPSLSAEIIYIYIYTFLLHVQVAQILIDAGASTSHLNHVEVEKLSQVHGWVFVTFVLSVRDGTPPQNLSVQEPLRLPVDLDLPSFHFVHHHFHPEALGCFKSSNLALFEPKNPFLQLWC